MTAICPNLKMAKTFGDKARDRMKALRLSQREVAESLGTNQPQVARWLDVGAKPPGPSYLLRLSRLLGVPVDFLLDDEQDEPDVIGMLSEAERTILRVVRALGLDADEALRRLSGQMGERATVKGREITAEIPGRKPGPPKTG